MYERHAADLYRRGWPEATLIPLDGAGDGGDSVAKQLDYSGIDVVLERPSGRTLQFGQRFRTGKAGFDRDFSLRGANAYGDPDRLSEREKLLADWRDGTLSLDYYTFGVGAGTDPATALEQGFQEWYVIDAERLCEALAGDALDAETHARFTDGSRATYVPIDDLRAAGAIVSECRWSLEPPAADGQARLDEYERTAHWCASIRPGTATADADAGPPAVATANGGGR